MTRFNTSTSHAFKSSQFPANTQIPNSHLIILDKFFAIIDTPDPSNGTQLASSIFTPRGIWKTPRGTFSGAEEISKSREHAWDQRASSQHEVLKVFVFDVEVKEVMIQGRLTLKMKDGSSREVEFVTSAVFEGEGEGVRLAFYQAWATYN